MSALPAWRRRQLREKHAALNERAETRINNVLGDLSGEFDECGSLKPVTLAFYSSESGTVCRDCRAAAGSRPLEIWPHASDLCARCGRPLGEAKPLPKKPMARARLRRRR